MGAVVVEDGRVLLVRRGTEPMMGIGRCRAGCLEVGESLSEGVVREVREETGLTVAPVELVELLDRIHRDGERVRYHYVIADYLCRVVSGELKEASDADAVRWVERAEWNSHSALKLDPITVRVIEAGWQRAREIGRKLRALRGEDVVVGLRYCCMVAARVGFWLRPVSYFNGSMYAREFLSGLRPGRSRSPAIACTKSRRDRPVAQRWYWSTGSEAAATIGANSHLILSRPVSAYICLICLAMG